MTTDLGPTTSPDVLAARVPLEGARVIDVGCGDMTVSRQLAELGATVLAVDPDPVQAERNRAAAPTPGVRFQEAGAEALPADDASVDGVVFSFSLHHVPTAEHAAAFAEVVRVLRPGGWLCVIEPVDGPLNAIMRHFHDEDAERAAAQRSLHEHAVPAFAEHAEFTYHSFIDYESFDAFATRFAGRTFNDGYTEADVRRPEVERMFEELGAPSYRFPSPKRMMLLRRPRGDAG
jgi:ubiquinone/menaquinone biosynthesis C-methylase UbiE